MTAGATTAGGTGPAWWRLPFLAAGFASLLAGVHAGLVRLGWDLPLPPPELVAAHGALMVSGFFSTLISLERAIAVGRPWAYLAPVAAGLGGLGILAGASSPGAPLLFITAAAMLCAVSLQVVVRQTAVFTLVMLAGATAWLIGNVLWLADAPGAEIVPWWALFFLLTIAGERLELTRLMPPQARAQQLFLLVLGFLVVGTVLAPAAGMWLLGIAWIALALWLATYDIARRTIARPGLPRFTAICLVSGYAWLALAGAIAVICGLEPGSAAWDAGLHALFLGFVFAMVFGHAPIIFPAILRHPVAFHRAFYLPLVVLNLSLAMRLAGDGLDNVLLRQVGGLGNAVAVLLLPAVIACGLFAARATRRDGTAHHGARLNHGGPARRAGVPLLTLKSQAPTSDP